jgi:hypothetical protein
MERKSIGRFSAEQIEQARQQYATMPKQSVPDMRAAMATPEGRRQVEHSIERVIRAHKHALTILKDR